MTSRAKLANSKSRMGIGKNKTGMSKKAVGKSGTIDESDSQLSEITSEEPPRPFIKAASEQIRPVNSQEGKLSVQISAPSYFFSLRENEAPPFKKPGREAIPMLLIGTIVKEEDVIVMIAAGDEDKQHGLSKFIGNFLVEKKIIENHNLSEKRFLINLLKEILRYAAQRDFPAFKLSVMITIYLASHVFYKNYYWLAPAKLWVYFKELMIRHTIEDSPDGQDVFDPEECYDILTHFHTNYFMNLPLVHILTFGVYRFKLLWPFKKK